MRDPRPMYFSNLKNIPSMSRTACTSIPSMSRTACTSIAIGTSKGSISQSYGFMKRAAEHESDEQLSSSRTFLQRRLSRSSSFEVRELKVKSAKILTYILYGLIHFVWRNGGRIVSPLSASRAKIRGFLFLR